MQNASEVAFFASENKVQKERKCWSEIKDEDNRVEIIFEGPVRRNFYLSNATKVWKHVFDKFVGKNFVGVPLPCYQEVVGSNTDRCCFHLPSSTYVLKQGYNCTDFFMIKWRPTCSDWEETSFNKHGMVHKLTPD